MADATQLSELSKGILSWNRWRETHPGAKIDLSNADLSAFDLSINDAVHEAHAKGIVQDGASWSFIINELIGHEILPLDLRGANLINSNLERADLRFAWCSGSDFSGANLRRADLWRTDLSAARFFHTDLSNSNLRAANLSHSVLIQTNLDNTDLGYAQVYGSSAWDLTGTPKDETALIVTPPGSPELSVDSLAMAQFLYLLIQNQHVRSAIDVLTAKVVLILGNFHKERKQVLDAVRKKLRSLNLIPILFDFTKPSSKDVTGTVETLARLSRFVIADLTDPSSVPHELATTVPFLRTTPVLMLRQKGATGYSMAKDLRHYPWVLPVHEYESEASLIHELADVINPAVQRVEELRLG